MKSDNRLVVLIFVVLVTMLAAPLIFNLVRDARRPRLVGVRIVTAAGADPVFATGARRLAADDELRIAAALELEYPGGRRQWLAPAEVLEIDGVRVEHVNAAKWPERDRIARVFWFTVEGANVGGVVDPGNARKRLRYSNFLAPEMGQELLAAAPPEVHNDDSLGGLFMALPVDGGTHRFYVRVDILEPEQSDVKAVQTAASRGPQRILEPGFPAVHRSMTAPSGIDPAVGELFNLGGWETEGDDPGLWDSVARSAFSTSFDQLVANRVVTNSRSFAAVAVSGNVTLDDESLARLGEVTIAEGAASMAGRPLRWDDDVAAGDMLVDGQQFTVLLEDDGNGVLDGPDHVIYCWRRPPAKHTLDTVFPETSTGLQLVRHGG
jgi:hypothetical protein